MQTKVTLSDDNKREEEIRALKAAWEAAEEGRQHKAEVPHAKSAYASLIHCSM